MIKVKFHKGNKELNGNNWLSVKVDKRDRTQLFNKRYYSFEIVPWRFFKVFQCYRIGGGYSIQVGLIYIKWRLNSL